jgi:high-affinity iron transporter
VVLRKGGDLHVHRAERDDPDRRDHIVNGYQNVVGEIEVIGPDTSAPLTVTLGNGTYAFNCYMSGLPPMASKAGQITGETFAPPPLAVKPVTVQELTGPNLEYQAYAAARQDWLAS